MELPKYFYFRVRPKNMGTGVELEDASDVDVAEVVRCKDCKFYEFYATGWCKKWLEWSDGDNDFCSWAERREDGKTD